MIVNVLIGLGVLIAGVLGFASTKPNEFRVERRKRIDAPPEKIFAVISDFHRWGTWSPWEKLDPSMTRTHSGAQSGRGAVYEWTGNKKVGQGRMEITGVNAPRDLTVKLDFIKPFEAHNTTVFRLEPAGSGATDVTWTMYGPALFMTKVMGVFVNMDKLIGKDFEEGLENLRRVSES